MKVTWSALLTQDEAMGGINVQMRQAVQMIPEPTAGRSLRVMLGQLVDEIGGSDRSLTTLGDDLRSLRVRLLHARAAPPSVLRCHRWGSLLSPW